LKIYLWTSNIFLYRLFLEGIFDANIFWSVEEKAQHVDGYLRRLGP